MLRSVSATLLVLGLCFAVPQPVQAQIQQKAYAPENLRSLSRQDQERVIGLEYSEQSRGRRIPDDQLRFYIDQVNRSNWTFGRIKQDIATSLDGGGWKPGPSPGGSVLCESKDNRRSTCNTGFRGRAALSQNLSKTRCIEGQNWGSGNGVVWVDGGCRARFVQGSLGGGGAGGTVRCESVDGRYRECSTGFRGNAVLTRKLSDARCAEGDTWGQRNGTVWVNRGCRAEFSAGGGNWNPGGGNNSGYNVTCSSEDNRRRTCAWNSRHGRPVLIQQLSSNSCREGSTWGYDRDQIWVDRGCRARFGVR